MTPSDTAHPEGERELLPCPFCGAMSAFEHVEGGRWTVGCSNEDCVAWQSTSTFSRKCEAVAAWNNRPEGLWRPISEAPTDGTHFLAHYIDLVDEYDEEDRLIARAVPTASIGVAYHVDWLGGILDYPYQGRIVQGRRYTDWQPLPAPPTHSNQGKPSS